MLFRSRKLLGHIVSKKGISIDPERIKAIEQIPLPHNKKGMQSFMGTINFVQRFVPDFAQIVKPLQQMGKQNAQFKWTEIEKNAFSKIKTVVAHAPSLKSPNFREGACATAVLILLNAFFSISIHLNCTLCFTICCRGLKI